MGSFLADITNRDVIAAASNIEDLAIGEWDSRVRGAVEDGPDAGRTAVTVKVRGGITMEFPATTSWIISWRREASGRWRAERLECIELMGKPPDSRFLEQSMRVSRRRGAPLGEGGMKIVPRRAPGP